MTKRDDMVAALRKGVCQVEFTKVNGDFRDMRCTLNDSYIPLELKPKDDDSGVQRTLDVIRVFDINAQGWRSFRVDNVVSFNGA